MSDWYKSDITKVLKEFKTDEHRGLSTKTLEGRSKQYGSNEIIEKQGKSALKIIFSQLTEILVLILIAAGIVSIYLHEYIDAVVIFILVVLNTILGFWQEKRAEKAIAALKKLSVPFVRILRDGREQQIPSKELVPGDIILLEAGNIIPADARLIQAANLKVQEAALTGESQPVTKTTETLISSELAIGDRKNMLFMGTVITYGRAKAIITETGMQTELGKIAGMLQVVKEEKTPLQKRLSRLGTVLAISALLLIVVVAGISLYRGESYVVTFMTAISMAVAAIPEGLPAVVTIALALGARKMLKKRSLIRNLPSVETLGSVTVICSDKTGTLTQNRMAVSKLYLPRREILVEGLAENEVKADKPLSLLLLGGVLCNDATVNWIDKHTQTEYEMVGDPTEGALVLIADKMGYKKLFLKNSLPRIDEIPFSSERKRMTTVHKLTSSMPKAIPTPEECSYVAFTKGAVDGLLEIANRVYMDGEVKELSKKDKQKFLAQNEDMANNGIRVLGIAYKMLIDKKTDNPEQDLIYIGMVGMIDPIRSEAREAVKTCQFAGIRPIMITGDHPLTALYIARELGIAENNRCLTGQELSGMSTEELEKVVGEVSVYARVSPEHKMKLVDALQAKGQIVAMTGDGVNDAPALKSADIGVAMGITGTDVAKQSADMVLLDDNFSTIVEAVKQGRTIYDNIKKFVAYILTGNTGEILVMLLYPFLGLPLPLHPIQILWINLVTDGAPGVALGYEKSEPNIMNRPPYYPGESIFARGTGIKILWLGALVAILSLGAGYLFYLEGDINQTWQTMVFTTLTFSQMQLALCTRSFRKSIFQVNPLSNKALVIAVLLTFGLQLLLIYVPFFQLIFQTVPLSPFELLVCFSASLIIILAVEVEKVILRRVDKSKV